MFSNHKDLGARYRTTGWATLAFVGLIALGMLSGGGCATSPATHAERAALVDESRSTLAVMIEREPKLRYFIDGSAGYAVFPNVGKGGVIVGGGFGRGTVCDGKGNLLGYAKVTQGSVGGVIGARSYALLLVFEDKRKLDRFTDGQDVGFGAEATAIALVEGSSATTRYDNGVAVFALPKGGLMADASLNGQEFAFEKRVDDAAPRDSASRTATVALPRE